MSNKKPPTRLGGKIREFENSFSLHMKTAQKGEPQYHKQNFAAFEELVSRTGSHYERNIEQFVKLEEKYEQRILMLPTRIN